MSFSSPASPWHPQPLCCTYCLQETGKTDFLHSLLKLSLQIEGTSIPSARASPCMLVFPDNVFLRTWRFPSFRMLRKNFKRLKRLEPLFISRAGLQLVRYFSTWLSTNVWSADLLIKLKSPFRNRSSSKSYRSSIFLLRSSGEIFLEKTAISCSLAFSSYSASVPVTAVTKPATCSGTTLANFWRRKMDLEIFQLSISEMLCHNFHRNCVVWPFLWMFCI